MNPSPPRTPGTPGTPDPRNPAPDTRHPTPRHLLSPGTAEVTADGVLHLSGADLDYAGLGDTCGVWVNSTHHTLTLHPGRGHRIHTAGPRGLIDAGRELNALGVDVGHPDKLAEHPPKIVRHSDGHAHWLTVRFDEKTLKNKVEKNKRGGPGSGIGCRKSRHTPRREGGEENRSQP